MRPFGGSRQPSDRGDDSGEAYENCDKGDEVKEMLIGIEWM